jgi:acyl-CoA thioesterase FadM
VYIEHTDSYQIVYNANYVSFCLHSLQDFYGLPALLELQHTDSICMNMLTLHGMRCLQSAILGDHLSVFSTRIDHTENADTWYCSIHPSGGGQPVIYDCLVTVGFFGASGTAVAIPPVIQQREPPHGKVVQSGILRKTTPSPGRLAKESCFSATCWLDTTDASGCLDPVFVLKLFERGRTNAFDGPSGLKTLQDAGVKVVVFRVENVQLHPPASRALVGQAIDVRTRMEYQEKLIVFEQSLWLPGAAAPTILGTVVCLAIDAVTGETIQPANCTPLQRFIQATP